MKRRTGAPGRTRTSTMLPPPDFESGNLYARLLGNKVKLQNVEPVCNKVGKSDAFRALLALLPLNREAFRPAGDDPSRGDIRHPSPGALGPGSRRNRRRYADPPAGARLTGLGAAVVSRLGFGVAMLPLFGCLRFVTKTTMQLPLRR